MEEKTLKVSFKKRTEQQVKDGVKLNDADVPTVTTTYDFSKLTDTQILQWAQRGVTIHIQSQIKSGALKESNLLNATFEVPEPGDRKRLSTEDKITRLVADLLKKNVADVTPEDITAILNSVGH